METIVLYHGSSQIVTEPEIRIAKFNKDFYFGFYCTLLPEQAKRWATRYTGVGYLNEYVYTPDESLNIKKFPEMTEEWLDFIAACRLGKSHNYDIVEGPMADDTVWNYVNDFLSGRINRKQFWALAEFRYPTHQISFHTLSALDCLTFIKSEVIYDSERKK